MTYLLATFLFLTSFAGQQQPGDLERNVYRFDAGSSDTSTGHLPLSINTTYSPDLGYGWVQPPDARFSRTNNNRFRDATLHHGVRGQTVQFRADLPAGKWWLTLWMEAGLEDTNTATLTLNDQSTPLAWNQFDPPAEPRTIIQNMYRQLHKPVEVGDDGFQFQLTGQADSVRILAFSLHPAPPATPENKAFISRLASLGSYTTMSYNPAVHDGSVFETLTMATDNLADVRESLKSHPEPLFASYWYDQIGHLVAAERLLAMRGWDWANEETGMSLFERIHQAIMILDSILDRPDITEFPFYERAMFSRGRLLYWLKVEGSAPSEIAGVRKPDLQKLHAMYPDDPLFAMYNGVQIEVPDMCELVPMHTDAPRWAQMQYETLCRLRDIAHWWINEQQAPNGELGGKFGDDVEILRWWPALILSGDTVAFAGWKRLADGVWESGKIRDGYAKNVSDVEHASEFVADTAPVMALFTDDPVYTDRLRPSARHFENLWTGKTPAGNRYFKSSWFSSSELHTDAPKNRDIELNTRATKAIRYLAWKTGDKAVNDLMHEWSNAWREAAMRTDKGKPAGIIPASIRFPDEAINGDNDSWYEADMFWTYFDWKHNAGSMILDQLLFSYSVTKNESLLDPLYATLALVESNLNTGNQQPAPGSPAWVANTLVNKAKFWSVVSQWRLYTGDDRFDTLLTTYGPPYLRYRLTGDENHLVKGLQEILDKVRFNTPLLTYEAIHTDRIYVTHSGSGSSHLKAMLTGDGVIEDMSPYPAVTWNDTDEMFTALVSDAGPSQLEVQLYSFSKNQDEIEARLWQLDPGSYKMTIRSEEGPIVENELKIKERGQRVRLTLPVQTEVTLSIKSR